MRHPPAQPRRRPWLLAPLVAAFLLLSGCSLLDSVPRPGRGTATPEPGFTPVATGISGQPLDDRPIVGTVEVWLAEYGLLVWQRRLVTPGRYYFSLQNFGNESHDLTIIRAPRGIAGLPNRQDRVMLGEVDIVARSEPVDPRAEIGPGDGELVADLVAGRYVLISGESRDFGRGMATEIIVGGGTAGPDPDAPPESTGDVMGVYLVDNAIFTSRDVMESGSVRLLVQNLGPDPHDLVVVRWRGDRTALPVEGDRLLIDSLIEVGRTSVLQAGERASLEFEVDREYAYVLLSSVGADYVEGIRAQFFVR